VAEDLLQVASITEAEDLALFADLIMHLGRGEAACLVLAVRNGWAVVSDENRRFRREAVSRIGKDRIMGTADFFVRRNPVPIGTTTTYQELTPRPNL
jgi:predicted nucleic acid-binding protein